MDTLVPVVIRYTFNTAVSEQFVLIVCRHTGLYNWFLRLLVSAKLRPTYQDCCRFCFLGQLISCKLRLVKLPKGNDGQASSPSGIVHLSRQRPTMPPTLSGLLQQGKLELNPPLLQLV